MLFNLNIITINREPCYLHQTLESMLKQDDQVGEVLPINLIVGCEDTSYVASYEKEGIARIKGASRKELQWMEKHAIPPGKRTHYKAMYNTWRAIHLLEDESKDSFVMEDDVSFCRDWLKKLCHFTDDIYQQVGDTYVLTVYSPYDWPQEKDYLWMDPTGFWGVQGMYYSRKARRIIDEYVRKNGVQLYTGPPVDLLIRNCMMEKKIPLIVLTRSLIQHEGAYTTGLTGDVGAGSTHRSPTFMP